MGTERAGTSDDDALQAAVAAVMARLCDGERQATWDLHTLAEPHLRRIVRAEARRIDVRIGDDDVLDLTLDGAIALAGLAGSWRPDGALPWVWARRRIAALVHEHVGTFADPLDERHAEVPHRPSVRPVGRPREVLRALAARHPSARRLDARLAAVASERDAEIWLGVQLEKAAGNRSPAVTVGADHELRPDAVRKVVQRVGQRLTEVA